MAEVSSMLPPIEVIEDDILADIEIVDRKIDLDTWLQMNRRYMYQDHVLTIV